MLDFLHSLGVSKAHLGAQTAGPFYLKLGFRVVLTVLPRLLSWQSLDGTKVYTNLIIMKVGVVMQNSLMQFALVQAVIPAVVVRLRCWARSLSQPKEPHLAYVGSLYIVNPVLRSGQGHFRLSWDSVFMPCAATSK